MRHPLRMGVIGLNNQGKDHIEAIRSSECAVLAAVCDSQEKFRGEYEVPFFESMEELFSSGLIDGAVVALPHNLHEDALTLAARYGVHVLKEKPIARTLEEAHRCLERVDQRIVLHTGVQRRHHGTYGALKEHLKGKSVRSVSLEMMVVSKAKPQRADQSSPVNEPWRAKRAVAGGGVLIDLGYHAVDLMHYLFGPMELISCTTFLDDVPCPGELTENEARVWAQAQGAWIRMHVGRGREKREKLRIQTHCGGSYEVDRSSAVWRSSAGEEILHASSADWTKTLQAQLKSFVSSVRENRVSANESPEQLPTIRFIDACYAQLAVDGVYQRNS